MHYYQHHIGDFIRDTARLKDSQCMAYLRLIWMYYDTEQPLENNPRRLAFQIGADADDVELILVHFFFLDGDVWRHKRCDAEISEYRKKQDKARESANARWKNSNKNTDHAQCDRMRTHKNGENKPDSDQRNEPKNATAMRTQCDRNANAYENDANQEPITKNQLKPEERERVTNPTLCVSGNGQTGADAPRSQTQKPPDKFSQTHVPQDFEPERAGIGLAGQHGLDVNKEVERFVAHYTANGALRANWQAQFRKWLLQAAQLKADALKRSRSPPNGGGGRQQLMMEAGKSLFAHRDEGKGHEREIEGTAEFVECNTDQPVAGIVDKQDL